MSPGRCLAVTASLPELSKNSSRHAATSLRTETAGIYRERFPLLRARRTPHCLRRATAFPGRSRETACRRWRLAARPSRKPVRFRARREEKCPTPGNTILSAAGYGFRLVGHDDFSAEIVERLLHRIQVARAVIHDSDHRSPLVLGSMRPRRRSREHATRRARAKALKSASILWWLERP